ncbi:uncharacterized threonine-rich GPI-anchored glycoprotein PJ4664.02-like isoform X2 [Salarias fasciatus]|uniref:Uncharacterized threonine-rich GPI-anchored glycoprotein PJ4664.02-like n=1 Tax=Salarias fasciatus TaxID=181472 RepID=A0A672IPM1_SALFA|nr:uncharacterized threonine-rich GPI-anchored glycoprotein PJ4664.02-like isoform X2 [Salarias fasciatus]
MNSSITMKLILLLTLLWTLSSSVGALQCLSCTDSACLPTQSVTCSSETMCITATAALAIFGQNPSQPIFRGCAPSSLCPTTGNRTFSVNVGLASALVSARCCNTDDCNSEALPAPNIQSAPPNGRECLSCFPGRYCSFPQPCRGVEDFCFNGIVFDGSRLIQVAGCISRNTCEAASVVKRLPFLQNIGNFTSGPTCCEGDLCNAFTTTTAMTTTAAVTPSSNVRTTTPTSAATTEAPSVGALQCLSCTDSACLPTQSVTCSSETMCITATAALVIFGQNSSQPIFRGCAPSSLCPTTGNRTFSVNVGLASALVSARCCNTDDCNSEALPAPNIQLALPNGRECLSCFPGRYCSFPQPCRGVEDFCFNGIVLNGSRAIQVAGCISRNTCEAASVVKRLPFLQNIGNFTSGPTCCEGDLCNAFTTTTAMTTTAAVTPSSNVRTTTPTSAATTEAPSGPDTVSANDRTCYVCVPGGDCSGELSCQGVEGMCFIGIVSNGSSEVQVAGCISQNLCEAVEVQVELPFLDGIGVFISGPTCCLGNLCNAFNTTTPLTPPITNVTSTFPVQPLQCLHCTDEDCLSDESSACPSETMCFAAASSQSMGERLQVVDRGCAGSSLCPTTGNELFGASVGSSTTVVYTQCCNTDNCNRLSPLFVGVNQTENGLLCFFCGPGDGNCSSVMQCRGGHDRCFYGMENAEAPSPVAGCISANACGAGLDFQDLLFGRKYYLASELTCCDFDMCNDDKSTTSTTITTPTTPTPDFEPHLGLRIRVAAFQGINDTTIIDAVTKFLKEQILNGTVHTVNVTSIKEDGSTT